MRRNTIIPTSFIILIFSSGINVILVSSSPSTEIIFSNLEDGLIHTEGVAGISYDNGTITVYVENITYAKNISSKYKGYNIKIVESGRFEFIFSQNQTKFIFSSRITRIRPLIGGISCGTPGIRNGATGTLGIVSKRGYILSCAHVLAYSVRYVKLHFARVIQPGRYHSPIFGFLGILNTVGFLIKYTKIKWYDVNYADAAIARAIVSYRPETLYGENIYSTYEVKLSECEKPKKGDKVRLSGARSGVMVNEVIDTNATVKVFYGYKYAIFKDVILVKEPFSNSGDSGSVVDLNGKFVGLAFASNFSCSVVCKAEHIYNELGKWWI